MNDDGLRSEGASLCDLPQVLLNKIIGAALETMKAKEAAQLATVRTPGSLHPLQGPAHHE